MSIPIASSQPSAAPDEATSWPIWLRREPMELLACVLITLGIVMLLQPFALVLFTYSFVTMLSGTVMFMVVSKFPQ